MSIGMNAGIGDNNIINGKRKFTNIPEIAPVVWWQKCYICCSDNKISFTPGNQYKEDKQE